MPPSGAPRAAGKQPVVDASVRVTVRRVGVPPLEGLLNGGQGMGARSHPKLSIRSHTPGPTSAHLHRPAQSGRTRSTACTRYGSACAEDQQRTRTPSPAPSVGVPSIVAAGEEAGSTPVLYQGARHGRDRRREPLHRRAGRLLATAPRQVPARARRPASRCASPTRSSRIPAIRGSGRRTGCCT
jgi:hypothetical protein